MYQADCLSRKRRMSNTEGSYSCNCFEGFEGDYCTDVDELNKTNSCESQLVTLMPNIRTLTEATCVVANKDTTEPVVGVLRVDV